MLRAATLSPVPSLLPVRRRTRGLLRRSVRLGAPWADHGATPTARWRTDELEQPGEIVAHAALPPDDRAALLAALGGSALSLSPPEVELWAVSALGRAAGAPLWGAAPSLPPPPVEEARRQALRRAVALHLGPLQDGLSRGDELAVGALAARQRDLLATAAEASRFPPLPGTGASLVDRHAVALGVLHAALGEQVVGDPGDLLPPHAVAQARSAASARAGVAPLVADLRPAAVEGLRALYLVPQSWGARQQHVLVAVVEDGAPLRASARLRSRLQQHGALCAAGGRVLVDLRRPRVLTEVALAGLLRRRLQLRPLGRLTFRLQRQLLWGEDVGAQGLEGIDWSRDDLAQEAASLIAATARCFRAGAPAAEAADLLLGSWPALAHLAAGGSPTDPLRSIHAAPAEGGDPGLAPLAALAEATAWGTERFTAGPLSELPPGWAPALLRAQEAALEALAAGMTRGQDGAS